jgi:YfiH family protein
MLKKFPNLIWDTSNRQLGDCRKDSEKFLKSLKLAIKDLVLAEQVHGNKIRVVGIKDKGQTIDGVDGLITKEPGLILGVHTADCLPVLFYDPMAKIIGACHAGWRGILAKLPQKMVDLLILKGAQPENIQVAVGPHICQKCYEIKKDLAKNFRNEFGQLPGMLVNKNGKIYLDLVVPVVFQLINSGILENKIILLKDCTSCKSNQYFSYRKDEKVSCGEMLSVISLIE